MTAQAQLMTLPPVPPPTAAAGVPLVMRMIVHQTAITWGVGGSGVVAGLAADNLIPARLLIRSWMLASGRTLRAGVSPQLRTGEELITLSVGNQPTVACVVATGPTSSGEAR
jgi:hypothetical protein